MTGAKIGSGAPSLDTLRSEDALTSLVAAGRGDPAYLPLFVELLRENHPLYDGRGTGSSVHSPVCTRSRQCGFASIALFSPASSSIPG